MRLELPVESVAVAGCRASSNRIRFAVVISHPIQHFAPLCMRLARDPDIELRVFYCCDWGVHEYRDRDFGRDVTWDIPMLDGYDHEFLPIRRRPRSLGFYEIDNPQVGERLTAFAPDAVWVHGYAHRTSWRVLRWARGRAAVLYFGDSELLGLRGALARCLKRIVLPRFFRRCDGFLTIGDNNEAYYRHYGVPASRMFRGCFPIDVRRFQSAVEHLTADDRGRMRERFGLSSDSVVALFVGKLTGIKRPLDLVEAVGLLRDTVPSLQALIVGSGPLEPLLQRRINELGLASRVRMAGFINQTEMPSVLWVGDFIAMCSEKDPHPLAVSEAMAVGNAVVASDRVGCVGPTDAARPGYNAVTYPCGDVAALAERLRQVSLESGRLERMRQASLDLAPLQDVECAAQAVGDFLQSIRVRNRMTLS